MTFPRIPADSMTGWGNERRVSRVTAMSGCLRSRRYGSQGLIVVGQQWALRPLSRAQAIDVTFNRELPMGHPQVLSGLIGAGCAYFTDKIRKGRLDMHRQRDLVLLVTLAVAAAVPAWGQAIKQAGSGAQGAASIPDLSGVWA